MCVQRADKQAVRWCAPRPFKALPASSTIRDARAAAIKTIRSVRGEEELMGRRMASCASSAPAVLLVVLAAQLLLSCGGQRAQQQRACEESGMCSVGVSKKWVGEVKQGACCVAVLGRCSCRASPPECRATHPAPELSTRSGQAQGDARVSHVQEGAHHHRLHAQGERAARVAGSGEPPAARLVAVKTAIIAGRAGPTARRCSASIHRARVPALGARTALARLGPHAQVIQLHYELLELGFAHHVFMTMQKSDCDQVRGGCGAGTQPPGPPPHRLTTSTPSRAPRAQIEMPSMSCIWDSTPYPHEVACERPVVLTSCQPAQQQHLGGRPPASWTPDLLPTHPCCCRRRRRALGAVAEPLEVHHAVHAAGLQRHERGHGLYVLPRPLRAPQARAAQGPAARVHARGRPALELQRRLRLHPGARHATAVVGVGVPGPPLASAPPRRRCADVVPCRTCGPTAPSRGRSRRCSTLCSGQQHVAVGGHWVGGWWGRQQVAVWPGPSHAHAVSNVRPTGRRACRVADDGFEYISQFNKKKESCLLFEQVKRGQSW